MKSQILMLIASGLIAGCADSPPQPTDEQRQAEILAHPMEYKPNMNREISNGDITSFDRAGFNKDINDAFNP